MTTTFYRHWRDVPESAWRWPNFSPAEIACRGTGKLLINDPRSTSCRRCATHMDGTAFDIAMANHDPAAFEAAARAVGFLGFGFYPRSGFMHIDLGPARVWGKKFPVRVRRLLWRRCRCGRCWLRAGRCVGQGRRAWPPWVRPA
jgi:zinc D-Ala-D-Ala carboxypeptidase